MWVVEWVINVDFCVGPLGTPCAVIIKIRFENCTLVQNGGVLNLENDDVRQKEMRLKSVVCSLGTYVTSNI